MGRRNTGALLKQLGFDSDLIERFQDFQTAYLDADQQTILAEAARTFIEAQVQNNPDVGRRWKAARARRGRPP
ncbi:hypothetical protein ACVISU_003949 [Bradyrhizobium sp. USDA 4452]